MRLANPQLRVVVPTINRSTQSGESRALARQRRELVAALDNEPLDWRLAWALVCCAVLAVGLLVLAMVSA